MRIVIDLQSCQSGSRKGGIGRYSMSLAKEMIRQSNGHDFWIVLNSLYDAECREVREEFIDLVPPDRIKTFNLLGPVNESDISNKERFSIALLAREAFIQSLNPDFIHISSLFEGLYEQAVTSVGILGNPKLTGVTLYDLIPLVEKEKYLTSEISYKYYLNKIEYLKKAGLSLAISEFSREEAIKLVNLPESNVVNISSAISSFFKKIDLDEDFVSMLKVKLGIRNKFIMYTSSYDQRKNQDGLIKAFATIPHEKRKEYQIVLVGNGWPGAYDSLRNVAKESGLGEENIIFPGFISDIELLYLYNMTSLFVFPSFREGFGLPILEAMACGAPTIGSNTTSIPEVIGRPDALFDPTKTSSIGEKMHEALFDDKFRQSLLNHSISQAANFSWARSARTALNAIENKFNENKNTHNIYRKKLTSIKSFNNEIVDKISNEITNSDDIQIRDLSKLLAKNNAVAEAINSIDNKLQLTARVAWVTTWNTRCGIATYSVPVINNVHCINYIFAPHESALESEDDDNVVRCWSNGSGDLTDLSQAVNGFNPDVVVIQFNYGFYDFNQLSKFINIQEKRGKAVFIIMHSTIDPPSLSDRQLHTISNELSKCKIFVHTKNDVKRLSSIGLVSNVHLIPLGVHEDSADNTFKQIIPSDAKVIASYGFALPNKGLIELIDAFYLLKNKSDEELHLLLVTAEFIESSHTSRRYIKLIQDRINEFNLIDNVTLVTDYLSNSDSLSLLKLAELIVIPYQNTSESSSGSARMALVSGRPVAVTPIDIFDDLQNVVYKLPGTSPGKIAHGIKNILSELKAMSPQVHEKNEHALAWLKSHGFSSVGKHLHSEILSSIED